jgi:type IV pilus assembly protein PilA
MTSFVLSEKLLFILGPSLDEVFFYCHDSYISLEGERMKINNKGFSLVELMVVVAIIGILAAIAVPNVNKYMMKSRQAEAKTTLASIYSTQKAFFTEYTLYHPSIVAAGFSPEGQIRYNAGFGTFPAMPAAPVYTGPAGVAAEREIRQLPVSPNYTCMPTECAPAAVTVPAASIVNNAAAGGPIFTATAIADLRKAAAAPYDTWTINNVKQIVNTVNGI